MTGPRTVRLLGGPYDGQTITVHNGERPSVILIDPRPHAPTRQPDGDVAPAADLALNTIEYRLHPELPIATAPTVTPPADHCVTRLTNDLNITRPEATQTLMHVITRRPTTNHTPTT